MNFGQVFIQAVGSPFMKNCSVALALFFGFFVAGVSSYTAEDGTSLPYVNSDKIDQAGVFTFLWTALFALLETSHSFLLQKPISTVEASTASVGELLGVYGRASDEMGGLAGPVVSSLALCAGRPPSTSASTLQLSSLCCWVS